MIHKKKLYYFNPTSELAIANGMASYQAPRPLQVLEQDLGVLPFVFASPHDGVVLDREVSPEFIDEIKGKLGVEASFVTRDEYIKSPFVFHELCPWAWSPSLQLVLQDFLKHVCTSKCCFSLEESRYMVSRERALELLKYVQEKCDSTLILASKQNPQVARTLEAALEMAGEGGLVFKAPWSASGRGVQILRQKALNSKNKEWLQGVLNTQGFVMVESLLNKVLDFSFHFRIVDGKVEYVGRSYFQTNSKGKYLGSYIHGLPQSTSDEIMGFMRSDLLVKIETCLLNRLSNITWLKRYRGYIGIDALLYRDEYEQLGVHPVLEINPRYTMGLLTLALERYIHPSSQGEWRIEMHKNREELGVFAEEMQQRYPCKHKDGLLAEGCVSLSDWRKSERFSAWAFISR